MKKILPFFHAVKLYWKAIRCIELTQYRRTQIEERQRILERNEKLERLGFSL